MSSIEEEIARVLSANWNNMHTNESLGRQRMLAKSLSPLLNRVRAEALREAAVKAQEAFVDEQGGIGYARVRTDWLHAEANRIEQNSEGNET